MDLEIFRVLHSIVGWSGLFDWLMIFLAQYLPYFLVAAWLFFILRLKNWRQKIFIFIFTALALILARGLIVEIIRFFYQRPRPFEILDLKPLFLNDGSAFPSGHTAFLSALAFTISFFNKKWGWWFLGLALANGLARVVGGVHWPGDVLAGLLVGFISFLIIKILLRRYQLFASIDKII